MPPYDVKIGSQTPPSPEEEKGDSSERKEDVSKLPELPVPQSFRDEFPMSARLGLRDVPGAQIEIRDSDGKVRVHDLPAPGDLRDSRGELRDSVGPIRRDSMGLRVLFRDSWAPDARRRRKTAAGLRDMARSVASWVLLLALSIDLLALTLEPIFVTLRGGPVRAGIATAFAAVGLSVFFSIAAAVPAAGVHGLVRFLGRQKKPWSFSWPIPLIVIGWLVVSDLAPHKVIHAMSLIAGQLILAALFIVSLIVAVGITRIKRARLRIGFGLAITAFAIVLNGLMPPVLTREPRDLLWLCTVFSFAAVFYPMRREVVRMPHERVSRWFGLLLGVSIVLLFIPPLISPDWRTYASNGGRFAPRLARFCRLLVDVDGDGYSSIAWGTDCDDSNPLRHPAIRERLDGIDHNCNGKLRPVTSTPTQRGLAPAVGEPDAAPGEIDRVVLVTIDCFRNDAFTPEVTPNLTKLAERGLRFSKMYSGGARTAMSLPFVQRGSIEAPTIAEILGPNKVSTTALFGYRHTTLEGNVFDGFQVLKRPDVVDHRIRAADLTDLALADLRDPAHAHSHYLWVHYFDAHGPRTRRVLPPEIPSFPPMDGESDNDSALYLSELFYIDKQVGRLMDGIEQMDGFAKTIVIMTNDHGEGFGRHGVFEHGVSGFEAITHSPGILLAPSITPGIYSHVVTQRDIAATVLGAFGLVAKHPEIETFARSWLRLRGAPKDPLHEFVVTYETTSPFEHWFDAPMMSIADDHGKLSVSYVDGLVRFYDLDDDPGEDNQIATLRKADAARYRDKLETFRDIDAPPH
ncbi:MAG: sulfatase-like hydrolase/transferase [Polyangiaceae bacterium]